MAGRVEGKRILFTGASTGIGRSAAELLVHEGAKLVFCSSNEEKGRKAALEIGGGSEFIQCDVRNEQAIKRFVEKGVSILGGLDVLIQNAGVQYNGKVTEFSTEKWDDLMIVNVRAHFLGAKFAIPHLRAQAAGSIINMSSVAGKRGGAGMSGYATSKGAAIAFTTALARELAPDNIRVNAICPGWVDTDFNAPAIDNLGGLENQRKAIETFVPLGRQATPDEIAPLFVYLASDESSFMTAQSILIDGGAHN
jgi:dihydroanticapsin dehydrogenase